MTFVGAVLGPVVSLERGARREERASAVVAAYGGKAIRRDVLPRWLPARYRSAVVRIEIGQPRRHSANDDPFAPDDPPTESVVSLADALRALSEFLYLSELQFASVPLTCSDLVAIESPENIVGLRLFASNLGGDLDALRRFKNLRRLDVAHSKIDDAALHAISDLRKIEALGLSATRISDDVTHTFAAFSRLQQLDVSETGVTDMGLSSLASLPRLKTLNLANTRVKGPGLTALASLKQLEMLNLARPIRPPAPNARFVDPPDRAFERALRDDREHDPSSNVIDLESMPRFPALASLHLTNAVVGEASFAGIARQARLTTLDLSGTNVADAWLAHLKPLKLEWLYLSDTGITGRGLSTMAAIPTIRFLRIERVSIMASDLRVLSSLPALELLALDQIADGSAAVSILKDLRSLKSLQISNSGLTDNDVTELKKFPALEWLNVEGNPVKHPGILDLRRKPTPDGSIPVEL